MNEVTKIHLGRQAFTASVDAYHLLRSYIDAIKKQVEDKGVVDEVELRMAELLVEHGVTGDKVILPKDVDFLKKHLGNPKDFKEDGELDSGSEASTDTKRLFRDTDNAMVAGVASGLAAYFGIDVLLVRILFVIGTIAWGGGILIYIVLWLLVPEARTSSDRLQMAGKSVTIDSLRDVMERADVKAAAHRANSTLAEPINSIFRIVLKIVGLGFIVAGLCSLLGLIAGASYFAFNDQVATDNIFPVGLREHLLLETAMVVAGLISIFIVLFGMAMFRRHWPIRTWITGMLAGLTLIGIAAGGTLAADVYPNVRDRYNANTHVATRSFQPFTAVNASGDGVEINYQTSDKYFVSLSYYDNPNLSKIKTSVVNGTLQIDSSQFDWHRNCKTICIPDTYRMVLTVYSPNTLQTIGPYGKMPAYAMPIPPNKP